MVLNPFSEITLFLLSLLSGLFLYAFLYSLRTKSSSNMFKKYFYIPVGKSLSNSQSLGGVVLLMTSIIFFAGKLLSNFKSYDSNEVFSFACFIMGSAIILGYGYLDDCHEVKARYKLLAQFIVSSVLVGYSNMILSSSSELILYASIFFFSMASLNGANLMDGADTISVKVGSSIFIYYALLGYMYDFSIVWDLSIYSLGPLIAFYFYNKYPSKIHLGEVGGAFLGFLYMFLALTSCIYLNEFLPIIQSIAISSFPLVFPVGELGITFCRRLFCKKRVFSGDHFHLHHLLIDHLKLSVSVSANLIGIVAFLSLSIQMFANIFMPALSVPSFAALSIGLSFSYILLGYPIWKKSSRNPSSGTLEEMFKLKKIELLSAKVIDDFEFSIKDGSLNIDANDLNDTPEKKKAS
jgi:UDP-N-acetylmuramyl pentapeptide phosphotransferase/UDP-N-acetylglucosamine-1-phosphate transferase